MTIEPVALENAFVRLEPLEERHRSPLRDAGNDPDLWRFANVNLDNADFDAWMDHRLAEMKRAGEMTYAVLDKASGAYAGSTSLLAFVPAHKRVEIGWSGEPVLQAPVAGAWLRCARSQSHGAESGCAKHALLQGDGAVWRYVRRHPPLAHGATRRPVA
jgi:hypothetical protein